MVRLLLGTYTDYVNEVEFAPPTAHSPPCMKKIRDLAIGWGASWLLQHPVQKDIWYAALEADDAGGEVFGVEGHIAAYRINERGSELVSLVSAVANPCHIELVGGNRGLAFANYTGGTAGLISLTPDGLFDTPEGSVTVIKYSKLGDRPVRCHQCVDVPANGECWVVDCGNCVVWKMKLIEIGGKNAWEIAGKVDVKECHAARQIVVSPDARHLYCLHAGACTVSHYDLSLPVGKQLVSNENILPDPHFVDMQNRTGPPWTSAAALTLHTPSQTMTATSRMIKGEPVDSVAVFKIQADGSLKRTDVLRPKQGKEYRGVGYVDDCFLVAGQHDGWMTCFQWHPATDSWEEKAFQSPVSFEKVVDIKAVAA